MYEFEGVDYMTKKLWVNAGHSTRGAASALAGVAALVAAVLLLR